MSKPGIPFPKHWLSCIVLNCAVLIAAAPIAIYAGYRVLSASVS
jgi:hypothetical protein